MYSRREGARFDHDYYRDSHLPMLQDKLGASLVRYTIDRGVAGAAPGSPPSFVAMCHLYFESVHTFQQSFAPHARAIMGDVPNYTDLEPVMQVSDVVVD